MPKKVLPVEEGGAIITNHKNHAEKIRSISNNGMTKPAFKRFVNNKYIPWDVYSYGFKANLSDINASILIDQIKNYSKIAKIKKNIYKFKKKLKKIDKVFFRRKNLNNDRDYYLFPIGVNKKYRNKINRIFV